MIKKNLFLFLSALVVAVSGASALASIQLHATRVIFNEDKPDTTLGLTNRNTTKPYLVQSWLEFDGKRKSGILLTPPMVRVDPLKEAQLRFFYVGSGFPDDVESLLWLTVSEIPPASDKPNTLQIAFRNRIKFFFRPKGLRSTVEDSYNTLVSKIIHQPNGKMVLRIQNPSPYHVTLSDVQLKRVNGAMEKLNSDMILPNSAIDIPMDSKEKSVPITEVEYDIINDYGGNTKIKQPLKS